MSFEKKDKSAKSTDKVVERPSEKKAKPSVEGDRARAS